MIAQPTFRVPVLIIGGFLGAGKTTLLNHILHSADGRRIVVFVNDYSAINIDFDQVETVEADRVSLENGCVCCTLNDDLIKGIAEFVRSTRPPDAIVIEASGVSDPKALDASLASLETAGLVRVDTRLYVFDAANFDDLEFDDAELIIDHAAANDLVLLNKTDMVSRDVLERLRDLLADAAPFSTVVETVFCNIAPALILGLERRPMGDRPAMHEKVEQLTGHSGRYRSWSIDTPQPLDRERFNAFAEKLPSICIRAKGILWFSDEPDVAKVFNLVGFRATLEPKTVSSDRKTSRLAVIGLAGRFHPDEIEQAFMKTLAC